MDQTILQELARLQESMEQERQEDGELQLFNRIKEALFYQGRALSCYDEDSIDNTYVGFVSDRIQKELQVDVSSSFKVYYSSSWRIEISEPSFELQLTNWPKAMLEAVKECLGDRYESYELERYELPDSLCISISNKKNVSYDGRHTLIIYFNDNAK